MTIPATHRAFQRPKFVEVWNKLTQEEKDVLDAAFTSHAYERLVQHLTPKTRGQVANLLAHELPVTGIILQSGSYPPFVILADTPMNTWWSYKVNEKEAKQRLVAGLRKAANEMEASLANSPGN